MEQAGPQGEEGRARRPHAGTRAQHPSQGEEEAEKDLRKQNQHMLVGFRSAYVFDMSQTEGAELPGFHERVKGEVGEYRERLIDFITREGIELEFTESIAPALGMSYGGRIAILPEQVPAEEFSTLVHELGILCCVRSYVA